MTKAQIPFCSDLPIDHQLVQVRMFIEDYSEKLATMPNGEDKSKVADRLRKLQVYYALLLTGYASHSVTNTPVK